jgi:ABC-2 type transport system ATP-binding protein
VIEVTGLRKRYGGRAVLDGVDLVARPGELVALLGPNGAGKTTTVEIIEGYRAPDDGTVRVLGIEPRRGGAGLKARVGLMLQGGAGLEARSTPRELLRLYAAFHEGGRRPDDLLEQVGLGDAAGTRVRRLSGGERQRLSLALALVGDPEVLLLDEPTAGMDPAARRETRSLVRSLRDEGRTILLTTHDLADVEELADRVVILHDGRVVAEGTPDELQSGGRTAIRFRLHAAPDAHALERLRSRLVARDRGVELRATPGAAHASTSGGAASRPPPASAFPPPPSPARDGATIFEIGPGAASADVIADLAMWAAREGLLLLEVTAGSSSLEERYLELTGDREVEAVA